MGDCILVGCDLHDKTMMLKYAVGCGEVRKRVFGNTEAAHGELVRWLRRISAEAGQAKVYFAYEASGQGFVLHDRLRAAEMECYVLAPTKMERSVKSRTTKCDERDAEAVLRVLRSGVLLGERLPAVRVPDPVTRDDRELTRAREAVAKKIGGVKTEVRTLLKRYAVERPKRVGKSWGAGYRRWLESLGAAGSLGTYGAVGLSGLLVELRMLEAEEQHLDEHVRALAKTDRYAATLKRMMSVKGVGLLTALTVRLELGVPERFSNRREVGAYCGLVPTQSESGETTEHKGHITHQGPPRLRRALCQAAHVWVRWDPGARATYGRLVARNPKKRKKIALVAMMRRLAIRLWHLAKGDVPTEAHPGAAPPQGRPQGPEKEK
jgi:transposase